MQILRHLLHCSTRQCGWRKNETVIKLSTTTTRGQIGTFSVGPSDTIIALQCSTFPYLMPAKRALVQCDGCPCPIPFWLVHRLIHWCSDSGWVIMGLVIMVVQLTRFVQILRLLKVISWSLKLTLNCIEYSVSCASANKIQVFHPSEKTNGETHVEKKVRESSLQSHVIRFVK